MTKIPEETLNAVARAILNCIKEPDCNGDFFDGVEAAKAAILAYQQSLWQPMDHVDAAKALVDHMRFVGNCVNSLGVIHALRESGVVLARIQTPPTDNGDA